MKKKTEKNKNKKKNKRKSKNKNEKKYKAKNKNSKTKGILLVRNISQFFFFFSRRHGQAIGASGRAICVEETFEMRTERES